MGTDAGKQLRVGLAQHHRHRRACRQPGDVDAARVGAVPPRDLAHDAGDQRRLAGTAPLVLRLEPVPALRCIRLRSLLGVHDQEAVLVRQTIHLGARREVVCRLGAAMQHHDHRARRIGLPRRNIDLVRPAARLVAEFMRLEAAGPLLSLSDRRLAVPCLDGVFASRDDTCCDIDDGFAVATRRCLGKPPAGQCASDGLGHAVHRARCGVESRRRQRPLNRCVDGRGVERWRLGIEEFFHEVLSVNEAAAQWMRPDSARRTAGLAWNAPSTVTDSMASRASSGVTSSAMRASPTTCTCSLWPAATTVSRSARL